VPKGLVHAVDRESNSLALTTVCGQPLDHLVRFPHYNFEGDGTRASRLVTLCVVCLRVKSRHGEVINDGAGPTHGQRRRLPVPT
jgi:hypothetical protein